MIILKASTSVTSTFDCERDKFFNTCFEGQKLKTYIKTPKVSFGIGQKSEKIRVDGSTMKMQLSGKIILMNWKRISIRIKLI